jgi:hypothetical protein
MKRMKKNLDSTHGVALRIALIQRRLRYCDVIQSANERLPADVWLTETALSKVITGRQRVKPEQAEAVAAVLGSTVEEIFPDLGKDGGAE